MKTRVFWIAVLLLTLIILGSAVGWHLRKDRWSSKNYMSNGYGNSTTTPENGVEADGVSPCMGKVASSSPVDSINTSDWQIYKNNDFRFQFEFPASWFVYSNPDIILVRDISGRWSIQIDIYYNLQNSSIKEWIISEPNIPVSSLKEETTTNKTYFIVNGLTGIFFGDPNVFIPGKGVIYNVRLLTDDNIVCLKDAHDSANNIFWKLINSFELF